MGCFVRMALVLFVGNHRRGSNFLKAPYALLVTRDGTLWIGTFAGLASWNGNKLTEYPGLHGWFVTALLEARDGTVWAGMLGASSPGRHRAAVRNSKRQPAVLRTGWRIWLVSFGVWLRTIPALSGSAQTLDFGGGSPAHQSDMQYRECGLPT